MKKCEICKEWYSDVVGHKCGLPWLVQVEEYNDPDDWITIYADDAKEAVKKLAEKYDEDDHPLLDDSDGIVVRVQTKDGMRRFMCTAKPAINYYADEIIEQ